MPQRDLARLARRLEPLACVLTDRLQHPEPVTLAVGLHESLVDERLQLVEDVLAGVCADRLDVRERAASGEDGQTPEQTLLRVRRAASGSSRSSARSVCCRSGTSRAPEVRTSRAWSRRSSSASGARSRRRAAASSRASGRPSRRRQTAATAPAFSGVSSNEPLVSLRALDEQRDRRIRAERLGRGWIGRRGKLQRVERVLPLGGDPEWRPARRHDPEPRAALDQARHVRRRRHDLLEVVQEQKRLLVTDQCGDALRQRPLFGFLHVQRVRESGDELRRVRHLGQRDERDSVEELGREQPAQLDDDARLPDTAGACDRDDPMFVRQLDERRQISRAADEWRGRLGQVARQTGEALALAFERLRIRHHDALGRDCVELERAPDVLEPEPSRGR